MGMLLLNRFVMFSLVISVVNCQKLGRAEVFEAILQANKTISKRCDERDVLLKKYSQETSSPSYRHAVQHKGSSITDKMNSDQEIYEEAARILKKKYSLEEIKTDGDGCIEKCPGLVIPACNITYQYRTYDGSCNNLKHPYWGMSPYKFNRLLPAVYNDGIAELRKSVTGHSLPTPRTVSLQIHGHLDVPDPITSHMTMPFGQLIDHDMSLTPLITNLTCCPDNTREINCGAIIVKETDSFYSGCNVTCLQNTRTQIWTSCLKIPRDQLKQRTSYLDASAVYGSDPVLALSLRILDDGPRRGELNSTFVDKMGEMLPPGPNTATCRDPQGRRACLFGGESRTNQNPGISSMHIIFLRLHNRIVRILRNYNPTWDNEKLYQEARRIVGAVIQAITYKEYLPQILGKRTMTQFRLNVGKNSRYNPKVDASTINEFATAAFRFGHSTINSAFQLVHDDSSVDSFELREFFNYPFDLYDGQFLKLIKGLLRGPAQSIDRHKVVDVLDHMYKVRGSCFGLDLGALNTFRGRDHGMSPYVDLVHYCGGPRIRSFLELELSGLFPKGMAKHFSTVYKSYKDIDLFAGGLAETIMEVGSVGPTFACIIAIQFHRMKFGDRFYFEHSNLETSFTPEQRQELRKVTLAQILCMTTEIEGSQKQAFRLKSKKNPALSCHDIELRPINLELWKKVNQHVGPYPK